jgi:hypothetical protein
LPKSFEALGILTIYLGEERGFKSFAILGLAVGFNGLFWQVPKLFGNFPIHARQRKLMAPLRFSKPTDQISTTPQQLHNSLC